MRLLLTVFLLCTWVQAHADFIDERSAPAKVPAAVAGPAVTATQRAADFVAAPALPLTQFAVTPGDRSIREALSRWARVAGWVHEPAHWALDKDFPVAAAAGPEIFGPEFKGAVRVLLSSTELTDRPVQPCFYTNNVVRVIPKAEFCDRTVQ